MGGGCIARGAVAARQRRGYAVDRRRQRIAAIFGKARRSAGAGQFPIQPFADRDLSERQSAQRTQRRAAEPEQGTRSEEQTSELQSLMRISYAVFCLKNKKKNRIK